MNTNEYTYIKLDRLEGEEFRLIPGCSKYYVSNLGRAYKISTNHQRKTIKELELSMHKSPNKTGKLYHRISISLEDGTKLWCGIHRAVLAAFVDPEFPLCGRKARFIIGEHINNDSEDNRLVNLRIATQSDNMKFARDMNLFNGKTANKSCVAYNTKTKEIREYKTTKELCKDIWNSENTGYFNRSYNIKSTTRDGWRCGYTLEEIQK